MPTDHRDPTSETSRLRALAHRMRHIYHTRVRTTTVVLVILWAAALTFYAFSSEHYAEPEPPPRVQQPVAPQPVEPYPEYQEPTSTVPSTAEPTPEPTRDEEAPDPPNPRRAPDRGPIEHLPDLETTTPEQSAPESTPAS
ncbi:hypothetical protein [Gordonia shandongensis]|uniref:hypothetical protein n=1 Tax=Gordonia shandongensis TaxID=376351 RepID=UPI00040F4F74|nr:hypothetical protein [Gordonia shandongensis]